MVLRDARRALALAVLVLVGCDGDRAATDVATRAPPPPLPQIPKQLVLEGVLEGVNQPSASVRVNVGDRTPLLGTADSTGRFVAVLRGFADEDFVSVTVAGSGSGAHVEFTSLLGTAGELHRQAGGGERLTAEDSPRLRVGALTTAMAGLIGAPNAPAKAANPESPVQTDSALAQAEQELDSGRVLELAGLIELIAIGAEGATLPESVPTTRALAANPDARNALREQLYAERTPAYLERMKLIAARGRGFQQLPATELVFLAMSPFDESLQLSLVTLGAGEAALSRGVSPVSWQLFEGALQLTPEGGLPVTGSRFRDADGDGSPELVATRETLERIDLHVLGAAPARRAAAMLLRLRTSYPDHPQLEPEERVEMVPGQLVAASDRIPFDPAQLAGSRQMLLQYGPADGPIPEQTFADLFDFSAGGTGSSLRNSRTFTWGVELDGTLQLDYADGETARFTRWRRLDQTGTGYIAAARLSSADTRRGFFAVVNAAQQSAAAFASDTAAGRYFSMGLDFAGIEFREIFTYRGDGTASQQQSFLDMSSAGKEQYQNATIPQFWRVTDSVLVSDRGRHTVSRAPCDPESGDPDCVPLSRRTSQLVARSGDRLYVLNGLEFNDGAGFTGTPQVVTARHFDYRPLP